MMSVMISIKPKWCERIASGKKTVEARKTRPKIETPFKCYIYCTLARNPIRGFGRILMYEDDLALTNRWGRGKRVENPCGAMKEGEFFLNGKIIGEFVCDRIDDITVIGTPVIEYIRVNGKASMTINSDVCLDNDELSEYANGKTLYGWHISDLVIYDKPKELSEFRKPLTCHRGIQRDNCDGCWDCEIKRSPQSWCYCEVLEND